MENGVFQKANNAPRVPSTEIVHLLFLSYLLIFLVGHTVSHQPSYYLFRLIVQQSKLVDLAVEILFELVKEYQMLDALLKWMLELVIIQVMNADYKLN